MRIASALDGKADADVVPLRRATNTQVRLSARLTRTSSHEFRESKRQVVELPDRKEISLCEAVTAVIYGNALDVEE